VVIASQARLSCLQSVFLQDSAIVIIDRNV
jgi:hypothetical protein